MRFLLIGVFGLVGVFSRYGLNMIFSRGQATVFPTSTFVINLLGSLLIGVVYVLGIERTVIDTDLRIALMVGLLGGFTTFSSYSLETVVLMKNEQYVLAVSYVLASTVGGLLLTLGGILATRTLIK